MEVRFTLRSGILAGIALLAVGAGAALFAQNKFGKPQSVLHVVTLYYKDGTTDAQKAAVTKGIEKMAAEIPGITNIWLKGIKVQGSYVEKMEDGTSKTRQFTDAFVIEFADQKAFQAYADHPAHAAWEKVYIPVRGRSTTHDITN